MDDTELVTLPEATEPYLYEPIVQQVSYSEGDETHHLSATVSRAGFEFTIEFTETKFDETTHVVEFTELRTFIDGRLAHGVDGGVPLWGLSRIEIRSKGAAIEVPEILYNDCYEFWMKRFASSYDSYIDGVILRILDDGVLQVSVLASDGAGTYLVHWWFGGGQQSVRKVLYDEAEMHAFDEAWKTEVPARPTAPP